MRDYDYDELIGQTPLMCACDGGDLDDAMDLLDIYAGIDTQDLHGFTPLMYAIRAGQTGIARFLIESGADIDVHENYDGKHTPLTLAARTGQFAMVKLLIAAGADVDRYGGAAQATAECHARIGGHHAISEYLMYFQGRSILRRREHGNR